MRDLNVITLLCILLWGLLFGLSCKLQPRPEKRPALAWQTLLLHEAENSQLTRCEFVAQSDVLCVGVFEQKRVGGRIDNKPLHYWWSLIDVIASFALQPAHVLLMTGELKWLLPLAPRSSQRPDGHKALIYYDFIITPGFNITWATKHIALFGKSNGKRLNNSTSVRVEFSVGFRGKRPARPPSIIDNVIENKPRFSSEDLEALLIHSCPVFSQHPAKKQV